MRALLPAASPWVLTALLLGAGPAAAVELPNVGGEPLAIDVVNTAAVTYRFDNRNDDFRYPSRYLDDNYGELLERLDAQVNWWRLQLGTRLNASVYLTRPSATSAELQQKILNEEVRFDTNDAARAIHSRYLTTVYPAKLWLTYTQPGVEATVGDFYAQLGRGLVFSVRKMDELAIDTTVRGGRVKLDKDFQLFRLEATAFAGQMNPLRVDDASGRRLHGEGSPLFFGFPTAESVGDLVTVESTADAQGVPRTLRVIDKARPSYLEDTVLGGRLAVSLGGVEVAANGALLLRESYAAEFNRCFYERGEDRQDTPGGRTIGLCQSRFPEFTGTSVTQQYDTIRTFSGSVSVPSIAEHGDLYVEVAGQQSRDGHPTPYGEPQADLSGYAVYAAANARGGPIAVSLEGKHYREYRALSANIDVDALSNAGFSAPEFLGLSYNQPPTTEPIYAEPLGGECVTGGRGRVDYRFDRSTSVYAWLGRYSSSDCADALEIDLWDTAAGTEIDFDRARSHVRAWVGVRHADESDAPGNIFYSEGYARYDVVKHLAGAFSLQAQGVHRRRYEPGSFSNAWVEGENYLALQWSPHFTATVGYEYTSQPGCGASQGDELCHFVNGELQWKSGSSRTVLDRIVDRVQLFVGQRRPGLRCVSGVCRFFPSFEGARLELVSKF